MPQIWTWKWGERDWIWNTHIENQRKLWELNREKAQGTKDGAQIENEIVKTQTKTHMRKTGERINHTYMKHELNGKKTEREKELR